MISASSARSRRTTGGCLTFFTFGRPWKLLSARKYPYAAAPKAVTSILPSGVSRAVLSRSRFQAREQSFDAVDAVPEQVGMMRLQLAVTVSLRVGDFADQTWCTAWVSLAKRRAEELNTGTLASCASRKSRGHPGAMPP